MRFWPSPRQMQSVGLVLSLIFGLVSPSWDDLMYPCQSIATYSISAPCWIWEWEKNKEARENKGQKIAACASKAFCNHFSRERWQWVYQQFLYNQCSCKWGIIFTTCINGFIHSARFQSMSPIIKYLQIEGLDLKNFPMHSWKYVSNFCLPNLVGVCG